MLKKKNPGIIFFLVGFKKYDLDCNSLLLFKRCFNFVVCGENSQ